METGAGHGLPRLAGLGRAEVGDEFGDIIREVVDVTLKPPERAGGLWIGYRTNGRPTAQWSRLEAGRSDNLGTTPR